MTRGSKQQTYLKGKAKKVKTTGVCAYGGQHPIHDNDGNIYYNVLEQQYRYDNKKICFYSYNSAPLNSKEVNNQNPCNGFELSHLLSFIEQHNTSKQPAINKTLGLPNKNTKQSIEYIQNNVIDNDEFACCSILTSQHWCTAILTKDKIYIFDPTLQTHNKENIVQIGDATCQVTFLNDYPMQKQTGQICGLCNAEFIINVAKYDNIKQLNDSKERVCIEVARDVYKTVGSEEAKQQLTDKFFGIGKQFYELAHHDVAQNKHTDQQQNIKKQQTVNSIAHK